MPIDCPMQTLPAGPRLAWTNCSACWLGSGLRAVALVWVTTLFACDGFTDETRELGPPVVGEATHSVVIETPQTLGVVDSPLLDVNGTPIGVGCETCHGPNPVGSWAATPGEPFHTGVGVTEEGVRSLDQHGELKCDNCHSPDRLTVHLADGALLDLADTMRLCAQCHGPQFRDYQRGSHGGMTGFWDLRQGPRSRNNCVVCHAPHSPRFEPRMPAPGPRDWYLRDKPHASKGEGARPEGVGAESEGGHGN